MAGWDAPVYGFYEPMPKIKVIDGRRCHIFSCAATGCGVTIRRYLDTNDKGSTSNLRNHSRKCWGDKVFSTAYEMKDVGKVREVVEKLKASPNGNIAKMFASAEGKGVQSYSTRQHTAEESRQVKAY